jgi:hypothetical protein
MDKQVEAQPMRLFVAKRDHLAERPSRVDMQHGIGGLAG